jgi:hypothetical protein
MSPRRIALALAAVAAALYLGVALPAVSQLSAVRTELLALRRESAARAVRLSGQRRREEALLRVGRPAESATLMAVRREIVGTLDQAGLTEVTVDVKPGRPPAVADVSVRARGSFAELMTLSERLAAPRSGLVLERVRLVRQPAALILEVEGHAVGALP